MAQQKIPLLLAESLVAEHTATELSYTRLSKGFVNIVMARRYGDLKGLFKGKIALISEDKNETNETPYKGIYKI